MREFPPRNISCSLFCLGLAFDKKDPLFFLGEMKVKVDNLELMVCEMFLQQKSPSKFLYKKLVGWLALMFVSLDPFLYELVTGCLILIR